MSEEGNLDYLGLLKLMEHPRLLRWALRAKHVQLHLRHDPYAIIGRAKCQIELQRVRERLEHTPQEPE